LIAYGVGRCEKKALEWYHWSDISTTVPREVNDFLRYGGPHVRLPLRIVAAKIDGQVWDEAKVTLEALNAADSLAAIGQYKWD
jgi:hypothetical protein